ncbi:MAG: cation:proton antiporter [Desulfobulbaceae bacterium]|nr:cation:proton antiporter [Desulfobulbaceae bacterium]
MNEHIIINLLLILSSAWAFGALLSRLGLPSVLGGLLVGFILGPPVMNIITPSPSLDFLAELGVFFVMYYVGLEMDPKELLDHFFPSILVAIGGFVFSFTLGFFAAKLMGATPFQSLFVGMILSVTAIAVQAAILQNMQIHKTVVGHVIIGAALFDDIISLICLSVLVGLAKGGEVHLAGIFFMLIKVSAFFIFTIFTGHFVIPLITKRLDDFDGKGFTFAILSALIMAYIAEQAGMHLIIGAFLAGQFVRKDIIDEKIFEVIRERFYGLSFGFLLPVFFTTLAFHVTLEWNFQFLMFSLVMIAVAFIGKFVGCGLGAQMSGLGKFESLIIGIGMNGRGAVELVVIGIVIKLSGELISEGQILQPLLSQSQISALILMVFITTLISPVLLKWALLKFPISR